MIGMEHCGERVDGFNSIVTSTDNFMFFIFTVENGKNGTSAGPISHASHETTLERDH